MRNSWHVATAAEAFAAGQFARFGWDVAVQYGANLPEYDFVAIQGDTTVKVSVKGSREGRWGLSQKFLANANYHAAAEAWLAEHSRGTVMCLVQFKGVTAQELPRMYLAWPREVAALLKSVAAGRGDTMLYERHTWSSNAFAAGTTDTLPTDCVFTETRLQQIACEA